MYLEVLNKENNRWEIHDPDYNLTYKNLENERVTLEQLISSDLNQIIAFNSKFAG